MPLSLPYLVFDQRRYCFGSPDLTFCFYQILIRLQSLINAVVLASDLIVDGRSLFFFPTYTADSRVRDLGGCHAER